VRETAYAAHLQIGTPTGGVYSQFRKKRSKEIPRRSSIWGVFCQVSIGTQVDGPQMPTVHRRVLVDQLTVGIPNGKTTGVVGEEKEQAARRGAILIPPPAQHITILSMSHRGSVSARRQTGLCGSSSANLPRR